MSKLWLCSVFLTALPLVFLSSCGAAPEDHGKSEQVSGPGYLAYFGTYTRSDSAGIYVYDFDAGSGKLAEIGLAAEASNPTFLAVHPNNRFLYAVAEDREGAVGAYSIEQPGGKLQLLNEVPSHGAGPCHLSVDATGKMLVVANYSSGSVASFPIHEDGSLGKAASVIQHKGSSVNPARQKGPHAHMAVFSPDNRFVIVDDLGLDKLFIYKADPATATIKPNDPPFVKVAPGSGPRHFVFHPSGHYGYANTEMGNTITAFTYDAEHGSLKQIQTISTVPDDFAGVSYTAEIEIDQAGKFLYVSNRGHDSIAVFSIDAATGKLTPVERVSTQGKNPRHFALDPTGDFLIAENQDTSNVVEFRVDQATGKLTPAGQKLEIPIPVCLVFVPKQSKTGN